MSKLTSAVVIIAMLTFAAAPSAMAAPPKDKNDAIDGCMANYSREGICDWKHWSEMYEVCELHKYPPLDDKFTIAGVKAGRCDWDNWSNFAAWLHMRPPQDKAQVIDSCMASYSRQGICDWKHWSEMYEVCELHKYPPLDDQKTIAAVKAGKCKWDNWSNFAKWLRDR